MSLETDKLKALEKVQRMVTKAVKATAIDLQERIQGKLNKNNSSLSAGLTASPPGQPPANRTGALMRSIQAVDTTKDPNHPRWTVGTNLVYARIQEFGGRITAKKSKYLPVPIGPAGYRAARDAQGKGLRSLNLKVWRSPAGKLFLCRPGDPSKRGKAKKDQLLFRLVKSVYLPARPYFRPAIAEQRAELHGDIKLGEMVT